MIILIIFVIQRKLKMIRDARSIIEEYESTRGTNTCFSVHMKEIQLCYRTVYKIYGAEKSNTEFILREILQYDISNGWKLLNEVSSVI